MNLNTDIYLNPINRNVGSRIIKQNHYSKSVNTGTKYTLGIYSTQLGLCGVIQLGWGVNSSKTKNLVRDTEINEFIELNRLWVSDELPKNSESKIISLMFKWIKENDKNIKWVISFADGVMGKVGTIYQATNFVYTGYNKKGGLWITKNGERHHAVSLFKKYGDVNRATLEHHLGTPLYRVVGGQFRYIYFLDKRYKKKLTIPQLPYPKLENLKEYIMVKKENYVIEDLWDEFCELTELNT